MSIDQWDDEPVTEAVVYLEGMVVVQRPAGRLTKRKGTRRPAYGWTQHRDTCSYLARATKAMPAPATPYPNTIPCASCKPDRREHIQTFTDLDDGTVRCACSCGAVGEGPTKGGARLKVYRQHSANRQQESA